MKLCVDETIIDNVRKYLYQALKDKMKFRMGTPNGHYRFLPMDIICLRMTNILNIDIILSINMKILPDSMRSSNIISLEKIVDEYSFNIEDFRELIDDVELVCKMDKSL